MKSLQPEIENYIAETLRSGNVYYLNHPDSTEVENLVDEVLQQQVFFFWSDRLAALQVQKQAFPSHQIIELSLLEFLIETCCSVNTGIYVGLDCLSDLSGEYIDGAILKQHFMEHMPPEMLSDFIAYQTEILFGAITKCLNTNEVWCLTHPASGIVAGAHADHGWQPILLLFSSEDQAVTYRNRSVPDFIVQPLSLFYFLFIGSPEKMSGMLWGVNWGKVAGITVDASWLKTYIKSMMIPSDYQEFERFVQEGTNAKKEIEQKFLSEVIETEQVWFLFHQELGVASTLSPMGDALYLYWSNKRLAEVEMRYSFQNYHCASIPLVEFLHTHLSNVHNLCMSYRIGLNFTPELWGAEFYPYPLQTNIQNHLSDSQVEEYLKRLGEGSHQVTNNNFVHDVVAAKQIWSLKNNADELIFVQNEQSLIKFMLYWSDEIQAKKAVADQYYDAVVVVDRLDDFINHHLPAYQKKHSYIATNWDFSLGEDDRASSKASDLRALLDEQMSA